ncbi:hypothetical protein BUALT_Bualt16G0101600 [Buddleja alternifolia]|uniref:Cotton fiber protein n=1 Tax=Buddleja alternifolia TaxID=168488 RepID=A0AAV6WC13_9LAMI|nr:hypothetical protein BUALT_Bualt16G0101600 [Buddleja alternifolia]
MAAMDRWQLLSRLKRAVKKITFLLNFNVNRFKLISNLRASSSTRRFSFGDRPGLRACVEDSDPDDEPAGSSRSGLHRTTSYPSPSSSSEDDIDKRADAFIANFYKQLQYERQISLELRYCRGNSFDSTPSP